MVYLWIFLGLLLGCIALGIANVLLKKHLKKKHSEKGDKN